ncbi:MAG: DUF1501 domain-containing protein [Pirellula sp.]
MNIDPSAVQVARRHFLNECGIGLGKAALGSLLVGGMPRSNAADAVQSNPLAAKQPHFPGKAKAVIHLFMAGAPSHLDLFDYKPELTKLEGKPLPESVIMGQRYAFIRPDAAVMGPRFEFAKHGQSGLEIANVFEHLPKIADDICLIRSVKTDQFNHAPAQIFFNTGFSQPGRPSLGSWVLYGLGAETEDLPAFVVMSTGAGISGGAANWSSGFLPTLYTGARLRNQGDPILNVASPDGIDSEAQLASLDAVNKLNKQRLAMIGDPEIATRIANYEMAFRLQSSAPNLMNLKEESAETIAMYGCEPDKPSFARACLLARRMVERGVRFINIYHEGWDAHSDVVGNHKGNLKATEQATVALVQDLKRLGMLDSTLVIWGGEFGRTPMIESNASLGRANGRDHHPQAYTMWMAGGGTKAGFQYGKTDDLGFHVVENPVHTHDLQATIMHCLGFDHERLTYRHAGRDFRLTDVHGSVVKDLLSPSAILGTSATPS